MKKRIEILLVCMMLVTSLFVVFPIETVKAEGNVLYVGGIGPGNYTIIQSAIDIANNGDTVFVFSGTYYENVHIYKTLNLIGENKDSTIIDGRDITNSVNITANGVNIQGFTMQEGFYGIILSKNDTLSDCKISNNWGGIGIGSFSVSSVGNNVIQNCEISHNTLGMHIVNSANNNINGNTFLFDSIAVVGNLKDCYQ
ncbi:MAG: hypothetical protein MUO82_06670, partial [Candidatus Thermoplasmatota archaeon]|nr:hypothetical protein [Candidatus Thermoplasmatota archaeon]